MDLLVPRMPTPAGALLACWTAHTVVTRRAKLGRHSSPDLRPSICIQQGSATFYGRFHTTQSLSGISSSWVTALQSSIFHPTATTAQS